MLKTQAESFVKIKGVKFIKSFAGIDEYQLDNGLKILLKPNKQVPMISWQVWYKVGSRNETPGLTGLAHYLEHIMFKGTQTFGKGEIAQAVQLRGGIFNAFTSDDYTAYFENFSPENLELAIKIESDRMQNSRIDPQEVELERSVIVSELEGNKNSPQHNLYDALRSTAYQAHSYRNPVIGWRSDLDNINGKNMREFYENYYYPDNATAVLVGNFKTEDALNLIKQYFGQYKAKTNYRHKVTQEPEQKATKRIVVKDEGYMKLLGIAFHIPEFKHDDTPALHTIAEVLFNGMSSRLYSKLVDGGLVTDISAAPESNRDPGIFRILVSLNPEADINEVERIINTELEAVKEGITEDELRIAKAKEEAAYVYQLDGVYDEGLQIGFAESVTDDWTRYITWVDEIKKVSNEDIKRVANKYFVPGNKTVAQLLPEAMSTTLVEELPHNPELSLANYGAGTLEPLDPQKLDRLLKLTEPKYNKKAEKTKLDLDFKTLDMDNTGIKIYYREDKQLPLVFFNVNFYAGSSNDRTKPALAYLTSEMLSRGSKNKDKYEIAKLLDFYGAQIDFDSGKETAALQVSTLSKYLPEVIKLVNEILTEPRFDTKELEKLKVQTIAQLKQEDDYPSSVAKREITQIIYPEGHPYYVYSVESRIKSVETITIDDIKDFYHRHYNSKNLMIAVVGDIDEGATKDLIRNSFMNWNKPSDSSTILGNNPPQIPLVEVKAPQQKIITQDAKTQSEIIMSHASQVDRKHPDFYPLLIANYALGGSALSSRLGAKVRDENGLVYNVRSSFDATLGAGSFNVILGCNPKNVNKAIDLSKATIKEFLDKGISETELKVTKSYMIGSFAVRSFPSNEEMVDSLSQMLVYNLGRDYVRGYGDMINAVTLEQVNAAARKYIQPDKLNTVIVGPKI